MGTEVQTGIESRYSSRIKPDRAFEYQPGLDISTELKNQSFLMNEKGLPRGKIKHKRASSGAISLKQSASKGRGHHSRKSSWANSKERYRHFSKRNSVKSTKTDRPQKGVGTVRTRSRANHRSKSKKRRASQASKLLNSSLVLKSSKIDSFIASPGVLSDSEDTPMSQLQMTTRLTTRRKRKSATGFTSPVRSPCERDRATRKSISRRKAEP